MIPADEANWPCPECRAEQNQPPIDQPRNFFLEQTIEKFKARGAICEAHGSKMKLRKCLNQ